MIKKYVNDLKTEFCGYSIRTFRLDLLSGLTVTAVAIPLALAFAMSSGADASAGLVCAIVGGIMIGILSGASYQISGPTGAMAAVLLTVSAKYGIEGVLMSGFLAGLLLLAASFLKIGRIINLIPSPVIAGFTSGIAIIIAAGQVNSFFGVHSEGDGIIAQIGSYFKLGFHPNLTALLIGSAVAALMLLWPKKLNDKIPASLVGLIAAVCFNMLLHFNVDVVGTIPRSLFLESRLDLLHADFTKVPEYITPALTIALLCLVESLLCGASAGRMKNEKLDSDRELFAQGIGNLILPLFGGIPATAAIARSSVAIKSGAQTRLCGVIHAVGILLSMLILAPVMSQIPLSALAGVLIVTAWRMNDWDSIRYLLKYRFKSSLTQFFATMISTVMFDLSTAILIGIAVSVINFLFNSTDLTIDVSDVRPDEFYEKTQASGLPTEHIKVIYITGPLFFANINRLIEGVKNAGIEHTAVFSIRGVPTIDASSAQALMELLDQYRITNRCICVCGAQPKVLKTLLRAGLYEEIGEENFHSDALEAIHSSALRYAEGA